MQKKQAEGKSKGSGEAGLSGSFRMTDQTPAYFFYLRSFAPVTSCADSLRQSSLAE